MGGLTPPKRSLDFAGAREALHLVARRDLKDDFVIFPVEVGDVHGLGAEGAAEDRAVPGSQHGKRNDHAARGTRDHPADADVNLGLEWRLCLVPRARLPHFREGTIRQPALDLVFQVLAPSKIVLVLRFLPPAQSFLAGKADAQISFQPPLIGGVKSEGAPDPGVGADGFRRVDPKPSSLHQADTLHCGLFPGDQAEGAIQRPWVKETLFRTNLDHGQLAVQALDSVNLGSEEGAVTLRNQDEGGLESGGAGQRHKQRRDV